jgi:K+-transporting ATPase ATPase C chain
MNSTLRSWAPELRPLIVVSVALFIVTAVIYPLVVTAVSQVAFGHQANGSMVSVEGETIGSTLVGQEFSSELYFHGRPSAAGYNAAASSGSNLGPISTKLLDGVADDPSTEADESFDGVTQRVAAFRELNGLPDDVPVPADAITASASGLDPHISPATARLQVQRVADARGADAAAILGLVEDHVEESVLGIFGEPRVNVLELNIALDQHFPLPEAD